VQILADGKRPYNEDRPDPKIENNIKAAPFSGRRHNGKELTTSTDILVSPSDEADVWKRSAEDMKEWQTRKAVKFYDEELHNSYFHLALFIIIIIIIIVVKDKTSWPVPTQNLIFLNLWICRHLGRTPPRPGRLWSPPSLLSNGYQGLFPWG
jgi:hypothetical protein